jgi:hypothetical protein
MLLQETCSPAVRSAAHFCVASASQQVPVQTFAMPPAGSGLHTLAHGPPIRARASSGGSSCRIYPLHRVWFLEFEKTAGGRIDPAFADGVSMSEEPQRLAFRTLADAVAYAQSSGLAYRIVPPPRQERSGRARLSARRVLPRVVDGAADGIPA